MEEIIDIINKDNKNFNERTTIDVLEMIDNNKVKKKRLNNRKAAAKYRKKKEQKLRELTEENERLKSEIKILKGKMFKYSKS